MILHTVNKSPDSSDALASCLLHVGQSQDRLLLLEDGVFAAIAACAAAAAIKSSGLPCYALRADLSARGLPEQLAAHIEAVSYRDFVALCAAADSVQSWY